MMQEEYFEEYKKRYKKLKEISEEVWKLVDNIMKEEKISIIRLTNEIEKKIIELGAKPAFPVNISINEIAAHYTAEFEDFEIDLEKHMVKVDFGIMIDGYIFDTAKTYYNGEYYEIVEAAKKAFEESLKEIKAGNKINTPGKIVEEIAAQYKLKPIRNLGGHGLGLYRIHTEPSLINTNFETNEEFIAGMPIAWEVFITNGSGYVKDSFPSLIFEIKNLDRLNLIRLPQARKVIEYCYENFKTMPFAKRWIPFDKNIVNYAIAEGIRFDIIHEYPVLKEVKNSFVAQFETTIIV
ncbi:MAG: type II methionyl aminopeptidase [Candidatus Aenigmatarchaeota archaeon]